VVVGSGPNGLAAAIELAGAELSVVLVEGRDTIGGGLRTEELTLPGFRHDVCSAIHPLGVASPFFRRLPLEDHGLRWIHPPAPLAHPFPDGEAVLLEQDLAAAAEALGPDATAYHDLLSPLVKRSDDLLAGLLRPLGPPPAPLLMARFGLSAGRSAVGLARSRFRGRAAAGVFAGMAAHSILPLEKPLTAAVGLMFCVTAHAGGWPLPAGGSSVLAAALASYLESLGGEIVTGRPVSSMSELPPARGYLFDVAPRNLCRIAGDRLPAGYKKRLQRFRHGPGVFKIDWALSEPIPWNNPACRRAATVHLGGAIEDINRWESSAWRGRLQGRPFVLLAQQSLLDDSRAPAGRHTGWAYCHVPHGWRGDMTGPIESQIERFAPGFRDTILGRHVISPTAFERRNPNLVGGDITGGVMDARQLFTRPVVRLNPYTTPNPEIYICSASTPPGGGVHGMCGYHAARTVLRRAFR